MPMQAIVGGYQVAQVFVSCDGLLSLGVLDVPAQVKGEAHTPQTRNTAGSVQVTFLASAPAVDEQDTRHPVGRGKKGPRHSFIVYCYFKRFTTCTHKLPPSRTF